MRRQLRAEERELPVLQGGGEMLEYMKSGQLAEWLAGLPRTSRATPKALPEQGLGYQNKICKAELF